MDMSGDTAGSRAQLGGNTPVPSTGNNMTAGSERGRHMKSDIKRSRLLDNTESGSETDGSTRSGRPRWKRSRRDTDEKKPRSFCCPYFKMDPIHHLDCLSFI